MVLSGATEFVKRMTAHSNLYIPLVGNPVYPVDFPISVVHPTQWRIRICKAHVGAAKNCVDLSIYKALVVVATYLADFYNL